MIAVIDRIEGKIAVLELEGESGMLEIPVKFLPSGVKEGNVLRIVFAIDEEEEQRRREEVRKIQERLKNRK